VLATGDVIFFEPNGKKGSHPIDATAGAVPITHPDADAFDEAAYLPGFLPSLFTTPNNGRLKNKI
jgi:hypothetical protein